MLFNDRDSMRKAYAQAWQKHQLASPLQPLEAQLVDVIQLHPEFHVVLEESHQAAAREYTGDDGQTNPFLHMGLHIAIREQLHTDRPKGIVKIYQALLDKKLDKHDIEHQMMSVLADFLWQAQQTGVPPDENKYVQQLRKLS